jgi:hypothetical protein
MTGRALALLFALGAGALAAPGLSSCTDTTITPPTGIDEPPTIHIVSPRNNSCVELPDGPSGYVPVIVDLGGSFYLRPPGAACANVYNCGYLQLFLDNALNNTSATSVIDADLSSKADYGTFTIEVQLVYDLNDGGGQDIFDAQIYYDGVAPPDVLTSSLDGAVADPPPTGFYHDVVTITTARSCSDAGTGGAGGASGTGGMHGTGGTGGHGGVSGTGGAPTDGGTGGGGTGGAAPTDGGTGGGGTGGGPADAGASDADDAGG